ncbi:MAG: hypothetical protein H0X40_06685 [Chthoniobacterales bacterium]|nr:hypothetical protein [Chthoniobacterales bacterium]
MKKQLLFRIVVSLFVLVGLRGLAEAKTFTIDVLTEFDFPGATSTHPTAINNFNQIVGSFVDVDARTKGFLREANGAFSPAIVEPNDFGLETFAAGINDPGVVSGYFTGRGAIFSGFFLSGSSYTEYVVPGAHDTFVTGINNNGDFAGASSDGTTGKTQGFINVAGNVTPILIPRASYMIANAINNNEQYCGYYRSGGGVHGFYRDRNGVLQYPVDAPASTTIFYGINDRGWIVGSATDLNASTTHGVLYIPPKLFILFDYPGASFTRFDGINNKGMITGDEGDDTFGTHVHGFTARVVLSPNGD